VPSSDDVRDLLQFCSGMEGMLEQVDFTGRSFRDGLDLTSCYLTGAQSRMMDARTSGPWICGWGAITGDRSIFVVTMRR
jgi:hypothetical protein